jgi:hypothetical protein
LHEETNAQEGKMKGFRGYLVLGGVMLLWGCKSSSTDAGPSNEVSDAQLYSLQAPTMGWVYFANSTDTLNTAGNSAHGSRIRVRYNAKAATQLDINGRVRPAAAFPDSSLIVKDRFDGTSRTIIAIMFKMENASNSGPGGWVWAELDDAGSPVISGSLKGVNCGACHAAGIDYTRMNDAHP